MSDANQRNDQVACNKLDAFLNHVSAKERSRKLTGAEAAELRRSAEAIELSLGCR